jgi:hypothetical protein
MGRHSCLLRWNGGYPDSGNLPAPTYSLKSCRVVLQRRICHCEHCNHPNSGLWEKVTWWLPIRNSSERPAFWGTFRDLFSLTLMEKIEAVRRDRADILGHSAALPLSLGQFLYALQVAWTALGGWRPRARDVVPGRTSVQWQTPVVLYKTVRVFRIEVEYNPPKQHKKDIHLSDKGEVSQLCIL